MSESLPPTQPQTQPPNITREDSPTVIINPAFAPVPTRPGRMPHVASPGL